jgi:hypothetical protein
MTPDREILGLTNASIPVAFGFVEKHGNRNPFCMAITTAGKRTKFVPDVKEHANVLIMVRQHIADAVRERRYRAAALVQIVKYGPEGNGARNVGCTEAVQVTVDHERGSPWTCQMPFRMVRGMIIEGSPNFGPPEERFFSAC